MTEEEQIAASIEARDRLTRHAKILKEMLEYEKTYGCDEKAEALAHAISWFGFVP